MWSLPVCAVVTGCASILGIPSDSPSFCDRPENQGHDYCEDYDVGNALERVGPDTVPPAGAPSAGATMAIEPSDASPPNLIDFVAQAMPAGANHEVSGYYKTWNKPFVGLRLDADVRFVLHAAPTLTGIYGFMLIGSAPGACLGLAAYPWPCDAGLPYGATTFFGLYVPQGMQGCNSLVALGGGGGGNGDAGMGIGALCASASSGFSAAGLPGGSGLPAFLQVPGDWFHLTVQIAPRLGGAAAVLLRVGGLSSQTGVLPPGSVPSEGLPIVGIASAPSTPDTSEEVQFDNVTVDIAPQQIQ